MRGEIWFLLSSAASEARTEVLVRRVAVWALTVAFWGFAAYLALAPSHAMLAIRILVPAGFAIMPPFVMALLRRSGSPRMAGRKVPNRLGISTEGIVIEYTDHSCLAGLWEDSGLVLTLLRVSQAKREPRTWFMLGASTPYQGVRVPTEVEAAIRSAAVEHGLREHRTEKEARLPARLLSWTTFRRNPGSPSAART